ncbi:hypothetical protein Trydic_g8265 [Trypoxylus dichotomus]
MSFSSGTLFGEVTTMIMIPSLINLRCATYCEIHTLDLRNLCSIMGQYKKAATVLHQKLAQRIADAKMMQHPVLLNMKDKQQKRTSIRWLKTQWRTIYQHSKKKNIAASEISTTPCHMSNYLNMYALSGDVELKERVICLKSTCPYVMEPTSSFSKFVGYIIVLVVVMQVIMLPYVVFFNAHMSNKNTGLFYVMDLVYIFGLYFQMSTAVKTKEVLLTEAIDIIMFKSKQMSVILDVVAVFPFEFLGYAVGSSNYTCMLMHLNRILKLHKVYTLERAAENSLLSKAVRLRLFKFTVIFAYLVYLFGCILYGVACPDKKCLEYGWFAYYQNTTRHIFNNTDESERSTDFMISIGYAISLMLGLTDTAIYSYTLTDIILGMFATFIGYYIFSFCFSELAACTVIYLQENNDFQEFLKTLKVFNSNPDVPSFLKKNMYDMTICEWHYSKRHAISGPTGILSDAPDNLKKSILYQRIVDCLLMVPIFQECERSILWNLAPLALLNVVPPGTLISREDSFQKYLKVILRGYCRVETSIPTDCYRGNYSIYSTGNVFPLVEALLDINCFLKVVSITFAEVACIPFQSLLSQFKNSDPDFYADLKITLENFIREYDTILMRRKGRLPEMVSSKKSRGKGDFFTYDTNENFDDEKCRTILVEIGKWNFVQRFFLKSTFSPKKLLYIVWECFRCSVSLVNIIYTMTILKYAMAIHVDIYIQIFFLLITIIDFYIRLHCQYYNKDGIVVTHPWYTGKNYISGAFFMDLLANAPITFLGIESMFHGRVKDTITVGLMILTRPFQAYRVYRGIEYGRNLAKEKKSILLERIKYLVMVCVIFLTMAAILEHYSCGYERGTAVNYICTPNSWIKQSKFGNNVTHFDMIVITNYKVLSLFTSCGVGVFPMKTYYEVIIHLIYIFLLFALKWVLLAKIISAAIKGNTKLTQYQHDVNVMVKYLQNYLISETLIKEVVDHYENLFNRSQGHDVNDIVASFFTVLYADFTYFMYWPILKTANLFCGCRSTDIHYLCTHFKQYSYKKDAHIIRCNDVQKFCYIVYKGKVQISVAGTKLKVLLPGGCFGCLHVGKTRQTISATAMVHVELLCIESELLYIISENFPELREKLRKAQYLNTEYMDSTYVEHSVKSVFVQESVYMKRWQRFLINPETRWYLAYNYILSVHISTITSMLVIAVVARMDVEKSYYLYLVDVVFLTRILIGFHLSYVDHETGIFVRNFKSIAKKYATEWNGFWFDLFTCFPLELIATTITNNKIVYFCCWCNRSIRLLHLTFYYNNCKNKLTVSRALKWTYLMYLIAIVIHFMATIWWLVACPSDVCYYIGEVRRSASDPTTSNDFFLNFRITYLYVISIFSSTGVAHQTPRTILELAISIAIIIVSQVMIYTLTSGFANILRLGMYVLNNYEQEIKHLNVFIANANVSIPLINKVREYFVILWLHYSGVSMPTLIRQAPGYLNQDIMYALYGYHITNHVLFSKTHVDFIRQLLVHMDPQVYLPGQYVIEKGDIDERMYFLHNGEVKVFDKQGNNEIEQCVLRKGASFGEYQALKKIEHVCSVKTTVTCVIIILKTSDWHYLLDWFPASREILESRLNSMSPTAIITNG